MQREHLVLPVRGLVCRSCAEEAQQTLLHCRGVLRVEVQYVRHRAVLDYDASLTDPSALVGALQAAGYTVGARTRREWLLDLGSLGLCVLLAFALQAFSRRSPLSLQGLGYGALFLLGLMTSPHCIGMCGGLVLGVQASSVSPLHSAARYQAGRVLAYTCEGLLFGALGHVLIYTVSLRSALFGCLGAAMLLYALHLWGLLPPLPEEVFRQTPLCRLRPKAGRGAFLAGLLTALMPCGTLSAMWLYAMAAPRPLAGAARMGSFALGTVPLLFAFGAAGSLFPVRAKKYLTRLSAMLLLAFALRLLLGSYALVH